MTDNEINIAIAEVCGWKHHTTEKILPGGWPVEESWWTQPDGTKDSLPSYTTDLNACHEMENKLRMDETYTYGELIRKTSGNVGERGGKFAPNGFGCFQMCHLTPRQRCEAFLRALGKWRDE